MKKIVFLLAIVLLTSMSFAQDYKFGKVSKAELTEKAHPIDKDAEAAILYRNQTVSFEYVQNEGFVQKVSIHERIKIYNKEGFDYATKKIVLYQGSSGAEENVSGLKAMTYNLEGNKVVVSKLKKNQIFEEDKNKYWRIKSFTMPNINEGCVIEYKYEIKSATYGIDDIPFQKTIPINHLSVKVTTPEYMLYKKLLNPKSQYIPVLNESSGNGKVVIKSKTRDYARTGVKTSFNSSTIDYRTNVIQSTCTNIPALKEERFIDNLYNYQSKLILELNVLQFPQEHMKQLSTTWEKVAKTIYESEHFGSQIEKKNYYKNDIDNLISTTTNPNTRITSIFNLVKSKVKWNGFTGYTTESGVARAYKDGSGNVADINLMLVSMLRHAGLKANPVLISTRKNGIPLLPTRSGFNYVICSVELDGKHLLLDAANDYTTINILPSKVINWKGRLIRENRTSTWIDLYPNVLAKENVTLKIDFDEDLAAYGKIRRQLTNNLALNYRNNSGNLSNEQLVKNLEKKHAELEVSNLEVKNVKDLDKPVLESYDYILGDAMEEIGDKLYISPLLFFKTEENPFKEDIRNYPIDFVYPFANKYMVSVTIPEGYEIESAPTSKKVSFNGTDGSFTFLSNANGNKIQLVFDFKLNKSLILPEDYAQFKQFFQEYINTEEEKIVLTKKQTE